MRELSGHYRLVYCGVGEVTLTSSWGCKKLQSGSYQGSAIARVGEGEILSNSPSHCCPPSCVGFQSVLNRLGVDGWLLSSCTFGLLRRDCLTYTGWGPCGPLWSDEEPGVALGARLPVREAISRDHSLLFTCGYLLDSADLDAVIHVSVTSMYCYCHLHVGLLLKTSWEFQFIFKKAASWCFSR